MKKTLQIIKISIFMGILILPSLLWYGTMFFSPDTFRKLDYDLGEKRDRAPFPQEFHMDDYTRQLEAYYDDRAPFRSRLISWKQKLTGTLEKIYTDHLQGQLAGLIYGISDDTCVDMARLLSGEGAWPEEIPPDATHGPALNYIYECTGSAGGHDGTVLSVQEADYTSYGYTTYQCGVCGEIYCNDFVGKRIDNSFLAPQIIENIVIPGRFNWLFYAGDDSLSYYRGSNVLSEEQMETQLALMARLQELCDEKGIQLQFLILPNKEQVYPEYMPTYTVESAGKRTERFVDYVRARSDINLIYPLHELQQAEIYWQTYHQYDTHWNHAGAFVGTQALYKALGMPVTDLRDLETARCDATTSDLILLGGLDASLYPAEYDYEIPYRPEVTLSDIQGDKQPSGIYSARSDCGNDIRFVFIGDSFRCFMIDYLVKDFSQSLITYRETTDNRTDYPEEVAESIRNADILVMEAVERYDSRLYPAIERVIEILQAEE